MDILACGEVNDEVVWWRNDGNEDFGAHEHVIDAGFDAAHTVIARDLDSDGDTDILGAACMSSSVAWWENNGSEQFEKHSLGSLYGALWLDAADLDDDAGVAHRIRTHRCERDSIGIDDSYVGAHYGLALAYVLLDKEDEAFEEYEAVKSLKGEQFAKP